MYTSARFGTIGTDRARKFLEELYDEKKIHKQHRHGYVVRKLSFVTALFGLGSLVFRGVQLTPLLYLVPVVSLCYDIYIFAEDYKVKRIGAFIEMVGAELSAADPICDLERRWEKFLGEHREPFALWASLIITVTVSLASGAVLWWRYINQHSQNVWLLAVWTAVIAVTIVLVFSHCRSLRSNITRVFAPPTLRH
jgi:uncharacterized membrane protein YjdF